MASSFQNILIAIVGLVLVGFGYYLFVSDSNNALTDASSPVDDQILQKTQVFIERRARLEAVNITSEIFNDPRFTTLQTNTTLLPEQPIGNQNIFVSPVTVGGVE